MALTLAQYRDRVAKKGVPATGDASTQLTYCINFARREVWYAYEWPFKRVISAAVSLTSASATYALSAFGSTFKTIKRVMDLTNSVEVTKEDFDHLLDTDPALDDTGTAVTRWCWYDGNTLLFWPTLTSGSTVSVKAYGEKILTDLSEEGSADPDITDLDISEVVIMIAHARALVENDDLVKKSSEYRDAIAMLNKIIRNNYDSRDKKVRVPGWDIKSGNIRKR